jgi:hypothetical protein
MINRKTEVPVIAEAKGVVVAIERALRQTRETRSREPADRASRKPCPRRGPDATLKPEGGGSTSLDCI